MQIKERILIIILILSSFFIHVINMKFVSYYFTRPLIDCFSGFWLLIAEIPLYILPSIWVYILIYTIKKYKDNRIKWLWLLLPIVFWLPLFSTYMALGAILMVP